MKVVIFTACNDKFFHLLQGLIESLVDRWKEGFSRITSLRVMVFDIGLTEVQREFITRHADLIDIKDVKLEEIFSNYKGLDSRIDTSFASALLVRPFLPRWANDDEMIMWIDADIWVQTPTGLDYFVWGAQSNMVSVVPECGRIVSFMVPNQINDLACYFQDIVTDEINLNAPVLNAGLFAARKDSKLWEVWGHYLAHALNSVKGIVHFGIDQASFNFALYTGAISCTPLPFECNYCTWMMDLVNIRGKFVMPTVPFEMIHNLHLVGVEKWKERTIKMLDDEGRRLGTVTSRVDYKSIKGLNLSERYKTRLYGTI